LKHVAAVSHALSAWQVDNMINAARAVETIQDTDQLKAAFAGIKAGARPGLFHNNTKLVTFDSLVQVVVELLKILK
jgi:hypothetical protein